MVDAVVVTIIISCVVSASFATDLYILETPQVLTKQLLLLSVNIITFMAFYSAHIQLPGIIGRRGILPISATLDTIKEYVATARGRESGVVDRLMPYMMSLVYEKYHTDESICNMNSDHIKRIGHIDLALAALNIIYPHPLLYAYLYISYYAIKRVGGRFFNFQWDALLLETLLLSALLSLSYDLVTTTLCMGLFKWLLFRLMFGSGIVKAFSRDKSWNKDFTAMSYHFLTQPLPNSLGMYLHKFTPMVIFKFMTIGTLVVEGLVPLLPLLPLPWSGRATALLYIMLQLSIAGTGFFGYFNYLTIALSFCLFDDAFIIDICHYMVSAPVLARFLEICSIHQYYSISKQIRLLTVFTLLGQALAVLLLVPAVFIVNCTNVAALVLLLDRTGYTDSRGKWDSQNSPHPSSVTSSYWDNVQYLVRMLIEVHSLMLHTLFLGCHYGLFANMTKIRNEIIIEVSRDKVNWQQVEFLAKPGDPNLPPKAIWPPMHLPRIDWAMWFLALKPEKEHLPKWFWILIIALMEGDSPDLMRLLRGNYPTGNESYQYVKINLVNYTFTNSAMVARSEPQQRELRESSSNEGVEKQETSLRTEHLYWSVLPVRVILPPSSLIEVYAILDTFDERIKKRVAERKPPTAEDAKEIIMRTLFAKLKDKKS